MARRRRERRNLSSKGNELPAHERFAYILKTRYAGSQTQMAADLGCSPSTISRIVSGTKDAGPKLLSSLAALPGINRNWAIMGVGKPESPQVSGDIEEAKELLPGLPAEFPAMLSGARVDFSGSASQSTYVVTVHDGMAIANSSIERIAPGDKIVVDSDPSGWMHNINTLHGRLCVVRTRTEDAQALQLRRVRCTTKEDSQIAIEVRVREPRRAIERERIIALSVRAFTDTKHGSWKRIEPADVMGIVRFVFWQP